MFGLFGKKKTPTPPSAPGWEAIEHAFDQRYPNRKPMWWEHDGVHRADDENDPPENPLEAVAIYDGGTFWHYVTFGLSDLFQKESEDDDWSGFGYELTFRLPKHAGVEAEFWPVDMLTSLAKAAYQGLTFVPGHALKTGPLDGQTQSPLTALLMLNDPAVPLIETTHGKVAFVLLLGVEEAVAEKALTRGMESVVADILGRNRELVTRG